MALIRTSTVIPGWSSPPTARSSGTVSDTARHASESGAIVSPGSRIENWAPAAAPASMFWVRIWSCRTVTASTRPMTSSGCLKTIASEFVGSSGTWRTSTSSASIGLRAGIGWTATTTSVFCSAPWPAFCWAWLIR